MQDQRDGEGCHVGDAGGPWRCMKIIVFSSSQLMISYFIHPRRKTIKFNIFIQIMSNLLYDLSLVRSAAERHDGNSALAEGGDEAEGDIVEGDTKLNLHCTHITKKLLII